MTRSGRPGRSRTGPLTYALVGALLALSLVAVVSLARLRQRGQAPDEAAPAGGALPKVTVVSGLPEAERLATRLIAGGYDVRRGVRATLGLLAPGASAGAAALARLLDDNLPTTDRADVAVASALDLARASAAGRDGWVVVGLATPVSAAQTSPSATDPPGPETLWLIVVRTERLVEPSSGLRAWLLAWFDAAAAGLDAEAPGGSGRELADLAENRALLTAAGLERLRSLLEDAFRALGSEPPTDLTARISTRLVAEASQDPALVAGLPPLAEPLQLEVRFASQSAELDGEARRRLADFAAQLRGRSGQWRLEVAGHTDGAGSTEANEALSLRRAQAVRDELVRLGVDPDRLVLRAYGATRPVASNATAPGRARNRRVELRLVSDR